MKHNFKFILIFLIATIAAVYLLPETQSVFSQESAKYFCPMHPAIVSDSPGRCPICGMNLELMKQGEEHKNHQQGSHSESVEGRAAFPVPRDSQQLIGVRKSKVSKEALSREIRATGRVAFDPKLYEAIEEYKIALKTSAATSKMKSEFFRAEPDSLKSATVTKLKLLGLSEQQINSLSQPGIDSRDFLLPEGRAWIYAEVFESDLAYIKIGQSVVVTLPSLPQEIFLGKVASQSPVVDPLSRSLRAKIEVEDPRQILKPDMFVNALIKIELGEQLVVPDSALIFSGTKVLAFVFKDNDIFEPREVKVGLKADNKYAVLDGLAEGESVVSSANFLIDSESRIREVVGKSSGVQAHNHTAH